ncbi:hypothetical protein ACLIA0_00540 [Bacillaceae bacterium W0354]
MPLEQEMPSFLTVGFIVVVVIFSLMTIILWVKNKKYSSAYVAILLHLLLLAVAFYFFINAITLEIDYNHPMASEENSLNIWMASGFWGLSMLTLLFAVFRFTSLLKK